MTEEENVLFSGEDFLINEISDEESLLIEKLEGDTPEVTTQTEEEFVQKIGLTEEQVEETTEETPESTEETPEEGEEESVDANEYFKAVGEGLYKLGKFGEVPTDFKWTQETFIEKFEELAEQNAHSKIEDLLTEHWGDEGIEMFNDIFLKRVPVKQYLSRYAEAQDIERIDVEENENNQKVIVERYLRMMNPDISDEEIYEQIEYLEEKQKLGEKAQSFKKALITEQKKEMQRMAEAQEARMKAYKEAEKAKAAAIKDVVTKAVEKKEINGIPLSVKDSGTLYSYIVDKAYTLPDGRQMTELDKDLFELRKDPEKWVALAKLVKEGLNIKPIENKAKDKTGEEVFNFRKKAKDPISKPGKNSILDLLNKI